MNCEKAEQLIPLYVEADLDAAELQEVGKHLDACVACSNLAAEFRVSQSLLHGAALPEFDEAMFAEMRTAVQHVVARTTTRPSLAELLNPIWNWKLAFAAAAALLLLVGGIVLNSRVKTTTKNSVASKKQKGDESSLAGATLNAAVRETLHSSAFSQPRTGRKNKAQGGVSRSERNPGSGIDKYLSPERTIDTRGQIAANELLPIFPKTVAPDFTLAPEASEAIGAQEQETSTKPAATPEPEMLRIEIQTADPNIKIIWLTPKESISSQRNPAAESK